MYALDSFKKWNFALNYNNAWRWRQLEIISLSLSICLLLFSNIDKSLHKALLYIRELPSFVGLVKVKRERKRILFHSLEKRGKKAPFFLFRRRKNFFNSPLSFNHISKAIFIPFFSFFFLSLSLWPVPFIRREDVWCVSKPTSSRPTNVWPGSGVCAVFYPILPSERRRRLTFRVTNFFSLLKKGGLKRLFPPTISIPLHTYIHTYSWEEEKYIHILYLCGPN